MPPESFYDRADVLVLECLRLPRSEREALLELMCAGDEELRHEVESLLEVDNRQLEPVDRPIFEFFPPRGDADSDRPGTDPVPIPAKIGPYAVECELGSGGAAEVYLGRRADDSDPRPVALKVLRATGDEALVRRFAREGEILADLRHPSIATLRGAGMTDDGRPFLAMEYVAGRTLDVWVREEKPSLRRRLGVFIQLCEAISYAHGRLVVHGDLKPTNILVQGDDELRVLDFGIAKLLDPVTLLPVTQTLESERRLTPAYASPEQLRLQPLGTATDVYSAGVVLFELLAGRRPKEAGSAPGWRSAFLAAPVPKASEVATEKATSRRLKGDLDAILETALRPEPDERYASIAKLAEDLERHLAGLPVTARRGTWLYQGGRWLRRHHGRLLAAVVVLGAFSGWLADRERQRLRIEAERDKAEAVRDYLLELFTSANPNGADAGDLTGRELLDRGYARLDDLRDQPAVRASFMSVIGDVYGEWGELDKALELTEEALSIERRIGTDYSIGLAARLYGAQLRQHGQWRRSEAELRSAIRHLEASRRGAFELGLAWNELGLTLVQLADSEGARQAYDRALETLAGIGRNSHPEATSVRNNQAVLAYYDGRYAEMVELCRKVLEEQIAHFGENHPSVASALNNLAAAQLGSGDAGEAEATFTRALDIQTEVFGPNHDLVLTSMVNLAAVRHRLEQLSQAEALLREAGSRLEAVGRGDSHLAAVSTNNLANVLSEAGRWREAEPLFRHALELHLRRLGPEHPQISQTRANLGRTIIRAGRIEEGRREMEAGLAGLRQALGDEHPDVDLLAADLEEAVRSAPEH